MRHAENLCRALAGHYRFINGPYDGPAVRTAASYGRRLVPRDRSRCPFETSSHRCRWPIRLSSSVPRRPGPMLNDCRRARTTHGWTDGYWRGIR